MTLRLPEGAEVVEITDALRQGAKDTLLKYGVKGTDVVETWVPGSFELKAFPVLESIDARS